MIRNRYRHLQGWAVDVLAQIDGTIDPGILGFVTRLSPPRQQAALCVLAHVLDDLFIQGAKQSESCFAPERISEIRALATAIRAKRPAELISAFISGEHADGLLGALAKSRPAVSVSFYRDLVRLFQDTSRRQAQALVRRLPSLSADQLAVIEILEGEPCLLTLRWLGRLTIEREAKDVVAAVALLREAFIVFDEAAFATSVRETQGSMIVEFFEDWLASGDKAIPPPLDIPGLRPLTSTAQLKECGLKFGVCLGNAQTCADTLAGRNYYYVDDINRVIFELEIFQNQNGPVMLSGGLYGEGNTPPPSFVSEKLNALLREAGVVLPSAGHPPSKWDVLPRLNYAGSTRFRFEDAIEEATDWALQAELALSHQIAA